MQLILSKSKILSGLHFYILENMEHNIKIRFNEFKSFLRKLMLQEGGVFVKPKISIIIHI